jgi:hypothetical protein
MKQRITKQQYDELHDDQKTAWALSVGEHHNDDMKELETLPTIGQMIEFLDWHLQFPKMIIDEDRCGCDHCPARYKLEFYINPKVNPDGMSHGMKQWSAVHDELCDALWKAVKVVLEK